MITIPAPTATGLASLLDAAQQRPRPLPAFLQLLRSETAGDPMREAAALRGLRRYQAAPRAPAPSPRPAIASAGRVRLRTGGGMPDAPPVVLVPSLINPPDVLDLRPGRSLVGFLATSGWRPLVVDWGTPTAAGSDLSLADHAVLLADLLAQVGGRPPLVGYCLGGTIAAATAMLHPVRGLALVATPWRFAEYPAATRGAMAELWALAAPATEQLGLLPMEALQPLFWRIDSGRTITKYERLGSEAAPDAGTLAAFVRLEDWANTGPPLPRAAARDLFEALFAADLTGRGRWQVGGCAVSPAALTMPVLDVRSRVDRIVPAAAAMATGETLTLALGHVGMMVGAQAEAQLWRPLAHWLSRLGGA